MQNLFTSVLGSFGVLSEASWDVGQSVATTSGNVTGQPSAWKPAVSEYLGIPYAQPPIGSLRFAAPQAFSSSSGSIQASAYGNSCPTSISPPPNATVSYDSFPQTLFGGLGQIGESFDEDCLYLNLWTKPQAGEAKKAVLVWIHGGGFNTGSARWSLYDGARLADEHDVIVAGFNYRLGIFGFPRADFLDDVNLGYLDQRLAVEWVRDNIERFGGDPERITLFGQSAGAVAVDNFAHAWWEDPIVHAFIEQSGFTGDAPPQTRSDMAEAWYGASASLGCGGVEDRANTLACMREKPWQDIMGVVPSGPASLAGGKKNFGPVVDEKVVFANIAERRRDGKFARKPLLIGSNNNEGGLYDLIAIRRGMKPGQTGFEGFAEAIRCGPRSVAGARVAHGVPAFRYVYAGDFPNQNISIPGAWHGAEQGMVFGTTEHMSHKPTTAEQDVLSKAMGKAWTDFAKNPWGGLIENRWPVYSDGDAESVVRLGGTNSSQVSFETPSVQDAGCPALA